MIWINFSTYENNTLGHPYELWMNDLEEIQDENNLILVKIDHIEWLVPRSKIEVNDNLDFQEFKKQFSSWLTVKFAGEQLWNDRLSLSEIFSQYWFDYQGIRLYTPKYYNYENDSIDIELYYNPQTWTVKDWLDRHELTEHVQYYIDNIRKKTTDWYTSMEPSRIEDVDPDDHCVIYAIFKKHNVLEDIKEIIEDYIEDDLQYLVLDNSRITYEYNWNTLYLDYDNKCLYTKTDEELQSESK